MEFELIAKIIVTFFNFLIALFEYFTATSRVVKIFKKIDYQSKSKALFTITLKYLTAILLTVSFVISYRSSSDLIDRDKDKVNIKSLIDYEAKAVNTKDTLLIKKIFQTNATITDRTLGVSVSNPVKYYANKYNTLNFEDASHFNINVEELTENFARVTCGSSGKYKNIKTNAYGEYKNDTPNADLYELKKQDDGSWKIIYFSFK